MNEEKSFIPSLTLEANAAEAAVETAPAAAEEEKRRRSMSKSLT